MIKATNFRELNLSSADRLCWLADICYGREIACQGDVGSLIINIGNDIPRDKIRPEHVTSLACLIEYCTREGCDVNVNCSDEIKDYFDNELRFFRYWDSHAKYIKPGNDDILNLWKVESDGMAVMMRLFLHLEILKDLLI